MGRDILFTMSPYQPQLATKLSADAKQSNYSTISSKLSVSSFFDLSSDDHLARIQFVLRSAHPEMDSEVDSRSNTGFGHWLQDQVWMEEREKRESLRKQSGDSQGEFQLAPDCSTRHSCSLLRFALADCFPLNR